jgi:hypothetical protein
MFRAAATDERVMRAFARVGARHTQPTAMFRPATLARIAAA